jgi:hypothetical protein
MTCRSSEPDVTRTQNEFAIPVVPAWMAGARYRDVVRQQWNFHSDRIGPGSRDYRVDLSDVTSSSLTIIPDLSGRAARASLAQWRHRLGTPSSGGMNNAPAYRLPALP